MTETSTPIITEATPTPQIEQILNKKEEEETPARKSTSSTSLTSPIPSQLDWPSYLSKTSSKAASQTCFAQWPDPPRNEFRSGYKFETMDPRNQSSRCIATVIECQGPRMRLRLDGTDDRNDFWLMCDSDLVQPWNPVHAQGRHISPPLGFGHELSRWQKFMHRLIETTPAEQFAPVTCFRQPPPRPARNEFQVGDKLEAVDPKNPSLICPATVREIKADRLLVGFDGWSVASQFWTQFYSRDLFPCGWCQRAGHILQPTGSLLSDENTSNISTSMTTSTRKSLGIPINVTPKNEAIIPTIQNGAVNSSSKKSNTVNVKKKPTIKEDKKNIVIETVGKKSGRASLGATPNGIKESKKQAAASKQVKTKSPNTSSNNSSSLSVSLDTSAIKSPRSTHNSNKTEETTQQAQQPRTDSPKPKAGKKKSAKNQPEIGSIIVKTEPKEVGETGDENSGGLVATSAASSLTTTTAATNVIVYVLPNGSCGPYVIGVKFHRSHVKYGPGPVAGVYKSIVQSFVDDAVEPASVFKMVPSGSSTECVRVKTKSYRDKKFLVQVETEKDLWEEIEKVCKSLEINPSQLFSSSRPPPPPPLPKSSPASKLPQTTGDTSTNTAPTTTTSPAPLNNIENITTTTEKQSNTKGLMMLSGTSPVVSGSPAGLLLNKPAPVSSSSSVGSIPPVNESSHHHNHHNGRSHTPKRKHNESPINGAARSHSNGSSTDHHTPAKIKKIEPKNPTESSKTTSEWTVDQVAVYVGDLCDSYFLSHVDMFRHHEIDGKALLLLTTDVLMKYMGFKLGPALKLNNYLDKLRLANNLRPSISTTTTLTGSSSTIPSQTINTKS